MKQFFKFMFASMLGFFISLFVIGIFFFMVSFAVISSLSSTETVSVSNNTTLELSFNYEVPERTSENIVIDNSIFPTMELNVGLNDLTKIINDAKTNPKINGILLNLDNLYIGGLSKVNTIRKLLIDFKKSEKFIYAHGNQINEKAFFLASIADSIFLTPTGNFEFDGFGFELTFFKNTLDKLEIEPQIFQYGKFKGATEPFKYEKSSEENRRQLKYYLNSVFNEYLQKISDEIPISKNKLNSIANNIEVNSAKDALDLNLIDGLLYRDQVDSIIIAKANSSKLKKISSKKYLSSINSSPSISNDRIAVIYATGEITNSKGDEFSIGTENIIKAIRKARNNKRVKAIVMRVVSPGGSSLTSDMIWREVELTTKVKPFIVSMGNVAASGGYYISCNSDLIVAEPTTLTGSIGVFGIIPNAKKFFNNKLGITFDRVTTSDNSSMFSITKPLNLRQREFIQNQVNDTYYDFVSKVSKGRELSFEDVDKIAQGRIWSGIDAKKIGLVDTLGGLDLALEIAAKNAQLSNYKIIEYPAKKKTIDKLMTILSTKIENKISFDYPLNQIEKLNNLLNYSGILARLPFDYEIN